MHCFRWVAHSLALLLILALPTASVAQTDIWHDLLHAMRFADVNRASLEHDCRDNPLFTSIVRIKTLCGMRDRIPDQIFEDAAMPYLQRHVTDLIAREAITALTSEPGRTVNAKVTAEVASGKRDQLTPEEIVLLQRQNQSEFGRALRAFASDREQGQAVSRAILEYATQHPVPEDRRQTVIEAPPLSGSVPP